MNLIFISRIIRKHPIETVLLFFAFISTVITAGMIVKNNSTDVLAVNDVISNDNVETTRRAVSTEKHLSNTIFVEVSGAVNKPDVYEVKLGTRLKDVLDMAGGLADAADKLYVSRNYNLAKMVGDQEKIYIPYMFDINNGTFVEQTRTLEYLQPLYLSSQMASIQTSSEISSAGVTISLNNATQEELETLPGIGPVTAKKIIDSRPYTSFEELLSKKIIKQSVFDEIKLLIEL